METPGFLRIIAGPADSQSLPLETLHNRARLTFGRHRSCDYILSHPTVSRQHFFLEMTGGKVLIVDNSSGNGTFVNSDRISWAELKAGDKIQAGPFVLVAEISAESVSERQAAGELRGAGDASTLPSVEGDSVNDRLKGLYPREYLEGIVHFNAGRYFEAHEIWEEIWLRSGGQDKVFYQMLIQSAVGMYHFERNNWVGARGMHRRVVEKLAALPREFMSLDLVEFARQYHSVFRPLIEEGIEAPQPEIARPVLEMFDQPGAP
jgi:pSer/pThr/pTyr-binding forkhead associated (FHA) protein